MRSILLIFVYSRPRLCDEQERVVVSEQNYNIGYLFLAPMCYGGFLTFYPPYMLIARKPFRNSHVVIR